jgi:hypothetical protein
MLSLGGLTLKKMQTDAEGVFNVMEIHGNTNVSVLDG